MKSVIRNPSIRTRDQVTAEGRLTTDQAEYRAASFPPPLPQGTGNLPPDICLLWTHVQLNEDYYLPVGKVWVYSTGLGLRA